MVAIPPTELDSASAGEPSEVILERVIAAREIARARQGCLNSQLTPPAIRTYCTLGQQESGYLAAAVDKLGLSTRAYHRVLKVARTLADMAGAESIERAHLAEAIHYRALDRARL